MNTFGILYPTEIESGESEVHRRAKSKLDETQNELCSPLLHHTSHECEHYCIASIQELLPEEKQALNDAAYRSLENASIGETVFWRDNETGNHGSFVPTQEFVDKQGRTCRNLQTQITVRKQTMTSTTSACRLHDSAWQSV